VLYRTSLLIDTNHHDSKLLSYIPVFRRRNNGLSKRLGCGIYTVIVAPLLADNGIGDQMRAMAYVALFVVVVTDTSQLTCRA
jgi:hypothetical protein